MSDIPTSIYAKWLTRISYQNSIKSDHFECLYFVFSDGQSIPILLLPVAPQAYLNALPDGLRWPDLVQGLRGSQNSYPDLVWMSQVHFDENQNLKKSLRQMLKTELSQFALDSLMESILRKLSEKPMLRDLELGFSFVEDEQDMYYPISKVEVSEDPYYEVDLQRTSESGLSEKYRVNFNIIKKSSELRTPFFTYDSSSNVFIIQKNSKLRLNTLLIAIEKLLGDGTEISSDKQLEQLTIETGYLHQVCDVLKLGHEIIKPMYPTENFEKRTTVNCLNNLKNFQVRIDLPDKDGKIINFSQASVNLLEQCEEGLKNFLHEQGKYLITSRRGKQREDEMRLLRHQGCALLMLYESALYILGKNQTGGEKVNSDPEFMEYLFKKWWVILNVKTEKDKPFSVANKELLLALQHVVKSTLRTFRQSIPLFSVNSGKMKGVVPSCEAEVCSSLIELALRIHGNNILTKQKTMSMKDFLIIENEMPLRWIPRTVDSKFVHSFSFNQEDVGWNLISILKNNNFEIEFNGIPMAQLSEDDLKGVISIQTTSKENESYFSLNPSVFFMGKKVNPNELVFDVSGEFIKYQNEIYFVPRKNLPGVRSLMAFWQRLSSAKNKSQNFLDNKYVQLARHGMLDVLAMSNQGVQLELDTDSKKLLEYYKNLGKQSTMTEGIQSQIELKSYQHIGIQWIWDLYQMGLGGILSDEMGLGKTAQVLGFFELLRVKKNKLNYPSLIVVPTSLLHNWGYEVQRFFPNLQLVLLNSGREIQQHLSVPVEGNQIYVSTYGLMFEHRELFLNMKWNVVVFDEAHQLKNITAQRTGVARQLNSRFKLAMTGTPLENNLIEFYSLFDLVLPGGLGTISDFKKLYVEDYSLYRAAQMEHLRLRSKPVLMRRTKQSVHLELPEKIETLVPLEMDSRQKDLYRRVAMQFNSEVLAVVDRNGEASAQLHMLSALMRLRQICSHPAVIESVNYTHVPPKLEYLKTMLPDIISSGESVLVFTQFRKTMDLILPELEKLAPTFCLHGGMSSEERRRSLAEFSQSDKPSVLLMTLKTGGVGLNLTKASYVFHMEPWWNPAAEDQATDRAHRLGQTKAVNVYRLLMQDSLEERIHDMKLRKQKMYAALLDEDMGEHLNIQASQGLSKDDFSYLIGNL